MGKKQSTISPFLNFDLPAGNKTQIFDFTNDLILKDSCPFKISTFNFPFLVVLNWLFTNLVKLIFLLKLFVKIALIDFSSYNPKAFKIYGITKNLKHAAEEIGFPGSPNIAFSFPLIFANIIGLPGRIAALLK